MLKKTGIIFTLIVTIVLTTGSFFFHKINLSSYKKEFKAFVLNNKQSLNTTKLTIKATELFVNSKQLVWVDENEEIYYNGKLYDVITITHQQNKVVLTLLSDENEQKLNEDFASLYNNDEIEKSNHNSIKLLKQFLSLKYLATTLINFQFIQKVKTAYFVNNLNDGICTVFLNKETPPPNFS